MIVPYGTVVFFSWSYAVIARELYCLSIVLKVPLFFMLHNILDHVQLCTVCTVWNKELLSPKTKRHQLIYMLTCSAYLFWKTYDFNPPYMMQCSTVVYIYLTKTTFVESIERFAWFACKIYSLAGYCKQFASCLCTQVWILTIFDIWTGTSPCVA